MSLPLNLDFSDGNLIPDVGMVTFSAASRQELLSQERVIHVPDPILGGEIEVLEAPPWLTYKIEIEPGKGHLLRLKLANELPTVLTEHTLQVARRKGPTRQIPVHVNVIVPPG